MHLINTVIAQRLVDFTRLVDQIEISARAAAQVVRTLAAVQHVIPAEADEDVIAIVAIEVVGEVVAGSGEASFADEGEVLLLGTEHVADQGPDRVQTRVGERLVDVASVIDDVDVVAGATAQIVVARATVEVVVAGEALEDVVTGQAEQFVSRGRARQRVGLRRAIFLRHLFVHSRPHARVTRTRPYTLLIPARL